MIIGHREVAWVGGVDQVNYNTVVKEFADLLKEDSNEEIVLQVTSFGGSTAIGYAFYDLVKHILKPKLRTVLLGEACSMGVILFLAGDHRLVAPHGIMYFHQVTREYEKETVATRTFRAQEKWTDLLESHYAGIVSKASMGKLSSERVLDMTLKETVLSSREIVQYGLAHDILASIP